MVAGERICHNESISCFMAGCADEEAGMKYNGLAAVLMCLALASFQGGKAPVGGAAASPVTAPVFNWVESWGGSGADSVHNVAVDAAGNIYAAGEFAGTVDFNPAGGGSPVTSNGSADCFLSKFNASGTLLWAKTWGGSGRDVPNGLGVDSQGNVYVAGPYQTTVDFNPAPGLTELHTSNAGTMNNIFLSKFNSTGDFQWVKAWGPPDGGAEAYSIAVDAQDHIYVEGDFSGGTTNFNPWDSLHPDNHVNHTGPLANFDSFLSKFDAIGNFIWAKTWGGEGYDDGPGVALDSLGNIYVAGMYASQTTINFDPAGLDPSGIQPAHNTGFMVDAFLLKLNSNGQFQWVRTWGGTDTEEAGMIPLVDGANNVYVGGRFECVNCDFNPSVSVEDLHSSHGSFDTFLSKFDGNGTLQWVRTWGGAEWDAPGSLAVDQNNHILVTGWFGSSVIFSPEGTTPVNSQGGKDVFVVQYSPNGDFDWVRTWGGSGDDMGFRGLVTQNGTQFYVAGSFSTTTDFDPSSRIDNRVSKGGTDAFLSKFLLLNNPLYIPLLYR
jgi:hypothetical protein